MKFSRISQLQKLSKSLLTAEVHNILQVKYRMNKLFLEIQALVGESEDFESAKSFCRSNNASFPKNKLDFPNNQTHDYWLEVDDTSAVYDSYLLEVLNTVKSLAESNKK